MGSLDSLVSCDQEELLVQNVCEIYDNLSTLQSLKPSKDVDTLFTRLVLTCMPPSPIDVTKLSGKVQGIRSKLIRLCGEAEGLLESHFSALLGSHDIPLDHINIFPILYLATISQIQTQLTSLSSDPDPYLSRVGITSIVLASYHLKTTMFHNYDIDRSANTLASNLVSADPDLSKRMLFHDTDIMDVTTGLSDYEVLFLAALYMAPGSLLMLRSAHGARGFLYPIVEPSDLPGFEVLAVFHPMDDVINSVIVARKSKSKYQC
ncbi:hypothetical protein MKX01_003974 [Papaver californicum]|nr:hypothetical protein MKX01_003974 [Papaver californicum]